MRPVTESNTFLICTNAGPSTFAGRGCNPFFFTTSYNNDQVHSRDRPGRDRTSGYRRVFVMTPNYQAGRDAVAGFKSRFKGEVVDEVYVPLNQLDFSAELAKIAAARPDAHLHLHAGRPGREPRAAVPPGRARQHPLPVGLHGRRGDAAGAAGRGARLLRRRPGRRTWTTRRTSASSPTSRRSTTTSRRPTRRRPTTRAMLLDSAIRQVSGNLANKDALRAAIRAADFRSVRGPFKFGTNHYPVQDFWLVQVARRAGRQVPDRDRAQGARERRRSLGGRMPHALSAARDHAACCWCRP